MWPIQNAAFFIAGIMTSGVLNSRIGSFGVSASGNEISGIFKGNPLTSFEALSPTPAHYEYCR
jgi:hypothetical protein